MTQPTRLRTLIVSLAVLAFIAGASAGIAGDRMLAPRIRVRATMDDMSGVFERLKLTPEQRVQAEAIVERTTPRSQAIMMELAERLRAVSDSVDAELRTILTPEQRARLDSFKRDSRVLLKRKIVTPGGTRVDTLIDSSRSSAKP